MKGSQLQSQQILAEDLQNWLIVVLFCVFLGQWAECETV